MSVRDEHHSTEHTDTEHTDTDVIGTGRREIGHSGGGPTDVRVEVGEAGGGLSVWACGQRPGRTQRGERYAGRWWEHPAPTLPDLAAYVINRYTRPGEWVLDPMCGIGTTVVEAVTRGRRAVGIDIEPRWTDIARASTDALRRPGRPADAQVITGDARHADTLLDEALLGQIPLLFCAPPYGPVPRVPHSEHASTERTSSEHISAEGNGRAADLGGDQGARVVPLRRHQMRACLAEVLRRCGRWLRPGGRVVLTTRPWRTPAGELLDLPADVVSAGQSAGLIPLERCVALVSRMSWDGRLHARASATHRAHISRLRAGGLPAVVVAHHDVFIFAVPDQPQPAQPRPLVTARALPRALDPARESDNQNRRAITSPPLAAITAITNLPRGLSQAGGRSAA
jgi:SAM-dependent methyltransferase